MTDSTRTTERDRATVLAVDDEDMVLELVVEVLNELGVDPLWTNNPNSALQILEHAHRVDLLITDMRMPEMTGLDLALLARRMHPGLRVLFITGYSADLEPGGRMLLEGTALLTKPFTLDVLASKIQSMIR